MIITIVISLLIMILAIYVLSVLTEEFFIISLDQIAQRWKLPSNVAGASLMAIGSSAPELAIALFALFLGGGEHSDVGIGTIVGSAVFNILVITGASALVRPARITWTVVMRDCLIYVASIFLLLDAFSDGNISMLEALLFMGLYAVYIFVLFQWNRFMPNSDEGEVERAAIEELEALHSKKPKSNKNIHHILSGYIAHGLGTLTGNAKRDYVRTFLVSVAFIAGLSWILVESAVAFAEALHIPPVIVALTILAGGTSVPDMISSIVVARQGRGDMAVANAVGSNIFDILIGLGLPWLIALLIQGNDIQVGTANLWTSTLILLGTVFILFVFLSTGRLLNRLEGAILILIYIAYVVWTWMGG